MFAAPFLADEILDAEPIDQLLAIAVLAILASVPLVVKLLTAAQRRRTNRLRAEFGPDYDELVNHFGDWRKAEQALLKRGTSAPTHKPKTPSGSS